MFVLHFFLCSPLFSPELANGGKKSFLQRLWNAYKEVMEHFIDVGIAQNRIPDYQKHKNKEIKKLEIKKTSTRLDERFFKLEKGNDSFDFWLKLSAVTDI